MEEREGREGKVFGPLSRPSLSSVLLACIPAACVLAVAAASLRHTGSLAFPIDDGYIYSNYVTATSTGDFFTYNPGEQSGGITGLGWYGLTTLAYLLLSPLHAILGWAAPTSVTGDPALAAQAGHLYLAAYLPGSLGLTATALGVRRLAQQALPPAPRARRAREALCWLLAAVAGADLGLVWGAMSGLEVALSSALVTWAFVTLLTDVRAGRLRWSLLWAALLPWARPELAVFAAAGLLWLLLRSLLWPGDRGTQAAMRDVVLYALASLGGFAVLALIYFWGWGRPLPSSFYAKVGGLRLGERFFSASAELLLAGRTLPYIAGALTLAGSLANMFTGRGDTNDEDARQSRWAMGLLLISSLLFVASVMVSLPWFGQEDRYLLPIHPLIIVQIGALAALLVRLFPGDAWLAGAWTRPALGTLAAVVLVGVCYLWATQQYAVEVRNIEDGHVRPALWIAKNTPPDALIAAEPIGAVRLFSERRTIDLVGLTTPATLGTYADWARAWPALRDANAAYLLFYPAWFGQEGIPPWAEEVARFTVPDNRIVGDSVIAVYRLRWDLYDRR
jgi:hypothetical protein